MSGTEAAPAILRPGTIETMATEITARLQAVFPPAKRFGFQVMPARLSAAEWREIANSAPFVGLGWKGIAVRREFDDTFVGAAQWSVFLVAKNSGGVARRYFGDALGVGLYRMVQSCIATLNGWTVPGVGGCHVVAVGNMFAEGWDTNDCALAQVDCVVDVDIDATDVLDFGAVPVLTEEVTDWTAPNGSVLAHDDQMEGGA